MWIHNVYTQTLYIYGMYYFLVCTPCSLQVYYVIFVYGRHNLKSKFWKEHYTTAMQTHSYALELKQISGLCLPSYESKRENLGASQQKKLSIFHYCLAREGIQNWQT